MSLELPAGRPLFLDGGMGTQLQARGLAAGEIPELWNLTRPDDIRAVHAAYLAAGADIVYANTFGANPAKYHGDAPLADVIAAGIQIARDAGSGKSAASPNVGSPGRSGVSPLHVSNVGSPGRSGVSPLHALVALDVGPTGRLLQPAGDFSFDAAYDAFAEQVRLGAAAGADLVVVETMGDTYELKAAVLAAKENCNLPVIATVALGEDGTLLTGGDVECVAALLEGLRVDALGFNCGLGPDKMRPYVERLARVVSCPIAVKPNAGMPKVVDGQTVFTVGPEAFAADVAGLVAAGASIVGGCCGTTPAHIAAVTARLRGEATGVSLPRTAATSARGCGTLAASTRCVISSGTHALEIPLDDTIIIGERINPTGKKRLKTALAEGDTAYVLREAVSQAEAGAAVLDVNTGVPGLDEAAVLDRTVQAVQGVVDLPLQIDTSDPVALDRALRHYNGKALVNSVNGKEESLSAVLPLVAKYGGVVVALALDENGIPPTAEGRLAIARKILSRGAEYGLGPNDFVFDALCLAVSADATSANVVLETLRRVRAELGSRTVLGVSNISFGLPGRPHLNAAFYTLAMGAGLSAAIINPLSAEMMAAWRAYRALTGRDRSCENWIAHAEALPSGSDRSVASPSGGTPGGSGVSPLQGCAPSPGGSGVSPLQSPLVAAIRRGLKADAAEAARAELAAGRAPVEVLDGAVVPALEAVGRGFEAKTVFLPQLLMAADAAGAAFEVIRAALAKSGGAPTKVKGPIVIATVKGDIHDIGKNIVRALLENYGFKVIDLGRDVPPETVLEAARRENCRLVGLSALMTTTVGFMEETIKLIHAELPGCKVMVGGAVLTAEYAAEIHADFYSRDAMGSVRVAEEMFA